MKKKRRIFLYGNSVILGSIGASLRGLSQFEVTALDPPPQGMQEIDSLKPDIILFDTETIYADTVFSLVESNPTVVLIGVSPDVNLVRVWSRRQLRELTMQGLLELIKREANGLAVESGLDGCRPQGSF